MTRTITVTGTLARMDAIAAQIEYVLRQIVRLEGRLIPNYVNAVRNKYIKQFTFYGVTPGTWDAPEYLVILIDWNEHRIQNSLSPTINITSDWQNNANPDIIMEAQDFLNKCTNLRLEITWDFTYSSSGNSMASTLRIELECGESGGYKPPNIPNSNTISYSPIGLNEMRIKRPVSKYM
jgi:hypothetical protein